MKQDDELWRLLMRMLAVLAFMFGVIILYAWLGL
jgi:hypothetical protein